MDSWPVSGVCEDARGYFAHPPDPKKRDIVIVSTRISRSLGSYGLKK
jgi:hypothetical protein